MELVDKVLKTIDKYSLLKSRDNVVVGLSGGPDSVCLIHVLHKIQERLGISIYAVHINHMLRVGEAVADEEYVRQLCLKLGVKLYVSAHDINRLSKEMGLSLEETGREIRYSVFNDTAEILGNAKIAVAHNRNDQAETVLMRILRGTGIDGLKGMVHKRDNIIRPLLDIERPQIEKYCDDNFLNPRTDSSNLKNIYTRNKVRLDLIPYIDKNFNADIVNSIFKMSMLIRDDYDFLEQEISELYKKAILEKKYDSVLLKLSYIKDLHISALKRILRKAINDVKGNLKELENIHIELIIGLVQNGRTGAKLHLPGNLRAERSYESLKIHTEKNIIEEAGFDINLSIPGETRINGLPFVVKAEIIKEFKSIGQFIDMSYDSHIQYFDYNCVKKGINLRNRKKGDIFKPLKASGSKKMKEYFIDSKISRDIRDKIPLIAKNNEIVWVIGHKTSDNFKVTEKTIAVLKLEYVMF